MRQADSHKLVAAVVAAAVVVVVAVVGWLQDMCGPAGRGSHEDGLSLSNSVSLLAIFWHQDLVVAVLP